MIKADYIILGAGASGLMLAYRMAKDDFFDDKSIVIIDKNQAKGNDRTWCFWETPCGEWDNLLHKSWDKIFFGSSTYKAELPTEPYQYKMIRSANFYNYLWSQISKKKNFHFYKDSVKHFNDQATHVVVEGQERSYKCSKLFNSSMLGGSYKDQEQYPVLNQHFVGWFIKLSYGAFDASKATFMDFDLPQKGNTRFMYILPVSDKEALFEFTLFSEKLLPKEEYEAAIATYLEDLGYVDYDIVEKEYGCIPMTSYKFHKSNSRNILHIGTAGGWTKASTGYTFKNTSKKTKDLVEYLKVNNDLSNFSKITKFWFYDLLLLDVLSKYNSEGAQLFTSLFKRTPLPVIFRFLDEESSFLEDLKVITSVPSGRFIQALLKRLF
jgi:lycopene beta-cyclase